MFLLCLETTFDCNLFSMFYLLGYFLFPWKVSFIIPVLIFPQLSFHVYFQNQFERPLFRPWYQWTNVLEFPRIKIFLSGPAGNYLFKVNNRNTITRCEICSKLTIVNSVVLVSLLLTLTYFTPCYSVSIVNFEHVIAGFLGLSEDLVFENHSLSTYFLICWLILFIAS